MNFRVQSAKKILKDIQIDNLLDVGCRDCSLRSVLPPRVTYYGNDLFQNSDGSVDFVGDFMSIEFPMNFDCVIALDVVEHVDDPYSLVDRIFSISKKYIIISLPNIFDIEHKKNFLLNNTLGGKYHFGTENQMDRHRWVMNYDEIRAFFLAQAERHGATVRMEDVTVGNVSKRPITQLISSLAVSTIARKSFTRTIIAQFEKRN